MKDGLLSVVVPVYNSGDRIIKTVESIVKQSVPSIEVLIVNDCSDDASTVSALKLLDERFGQVRIINLYENNGVAHARNIGVNEADGEFIAFCDADDVCYPNRFELQLSVFRDYDQINLCCGAITKFYECGNRYVDKCYYDGFVKSDMLLRFNFIAMSSVMIAVKRLNKEQIRFDNVFHEDYALWLNLSPALSIFYINKPTIYYTVHGSNLTKNKWISVIKAIQVLMNSTSHNNISKLKAIFLFSFWLLKR